MLRRFFTCLAIVVALIIGGLLTLGALSGGSCGGILASGRAITAQSDSWYVTSNFSRDAATIRTAGRTIVIGPTKVQVDGRSLAVIDASVKSVDVTGKGGAIAFVADGRMVATCPR